MNEIRKRQDDNGMEMVDRLSIGLGRMRLG